MARRHTQERKTKSTDRAARLDAHITALGLHTIAEYHAFCARHGFSTRNEKSTRQRNEELCALYRAAADREQRRRARERNPDELLSAVWSDEKDNADLRSPLAQLMRRSLADIRWCPRMRSAIERLLRAARPHFPVFSVAPPWQEFGGREGNTYFEALVMLGRNRQAWVREPEDWKPRTHNDRRGFASLARHLLAAWPVPDFMNSVWFMGGGAQAELRRGWYLHLGRGENIRTAELPLAYTKMMAHRFMEAPSDLTIDAALRWGQVAALGGSERLARAIGATHLAGDFSNDEFWTSVIRWFVAQPMLDLRHVGPIVDYVRHQRFASGERFVDGRLTTFPPAQPNFTMKGRSAETMLRAVAQWHGRLAYAVQAPAQWKASGLKPLEFVEGKKENGTERLWTVRELLGSQELTSEGRAMHHCVATYANSCARGDCSIWALETVDAEGRSKELTLEVSRQTRAIVQARGKCNALATDRQRGILRRWAQQAGLTLGRGV